MNRPIFDRIEEKLALLAGQPGVSESHGTLCGLLCAGHASLEETDWLRQLFPDVEPGAEMEAVFDELYRKTNSELNDGGFTFSPLLPDDGRSIELRIASLGEWCQGFLLGLTLGGLRQTQQLSAEAREILQDLTEMGQAGSYQLEGDEQDERSYMELVEYLRAGVLLLHDELGASRRPANGDRLH